MKPCDISKPYVFVSYKREDREIIMKVLGELQEKYQTNIWIDTELASKGGTTWNSEATAALAKKECKCVLFFMSDVSMMSGPVLAELYFSQNSKKVRRNNGNNPLKIIPICLSNDLSKHGLSGWVYDILPNHERANEKIKDSDLQAWKEVYLPETYREGSDAITEISEIAGAIAECIFDGKDTITHIEPSVEAIYKNIREYEGVTNLQGEEQKQEDTVEEQKPEDAVTVVDSSVKKHRTVNVKQDGVRELPVIESYPIQITRDMTLEQFERLFEDDNFAIYLRNLRAIGGKAYSKQMVDYLMATLLRGCDQKAEKDTAKWKYCTFGVASKVDLDNLSLGASQFTWQSNSRKAVKIEGSGKLGENSMIFEALSPKLSLSDVEQKFVNNEKGFVTKDNLQIMNVFKALFGEK